MKLRTIWTLRGMPLREKLIRTREWAARGFADHLPVRVRYWVAVQTMARVSCYPPLDNRDPMGVTVEEVMMNMPRPKVVT